MKNRLKTMTTASRWRAILRSRSLQLMVLAGLLLFVVFKVALPLFVSTASVRAEMEAALSAWTGGRATIAGEPSISFWPHPRLTLHGVTIVTHAETPERLVQADAITADFNVLAALKGAPVFYDFQLLDPVIRVVRHSQGDYNWRRAAWMAEATDGSPDGTGVEEALARDTAIGEISIRNGTLDIIDERTNGLQRVSNISGTVKWPSPVAPIRADLSVVINGEAVSLSFACDDPLAFFAARSAPIRMSLSSAPVTMAFDGAGSLAASSFFTGQLSFNAPSLAALLRWYGSDPGSDAAAGALSMEGAVTVAGQSIKLDDLTLSMGEADANGVLDIVMPKDETPRLDGTLAFDTLDLDTLLTDTPNASDLSARIATVSLLGYLKDIHVDLRLSAQRASLGPIVLTDLAAGILSEHGRTLIDIGDSRYFGGALSGRMSVTEKGGTVSLTLRDADLADIAERFSLTGPLPLGRGTLNIDLASTRSFATLTAGDLSGRIRLAVNDGTLVNFNADTFESLLAKDAFFSLNDVASGAFDFTSADIEADIANGVADLTRADIAGSENVISLSGRIPYNTGSLALAGLVRPLDTATPSAPLRFFVGGVWPNPVISPLSVLTRP